MKNEARPTRSKDLLTAKQMLDKYPDNHELAAIEYAKQFVNMFWQKSRIVIHKEGNALRYDEQALILGDYVGAWVSVDEESIRNVEKLML